MAASNDCPSAPSRVVGLQYTAGEPAPLVVLKGVGPQVQAVVAAARANPDLNMVRDAELVNELYRVPIGGPVSSNLFPIMASLLIHVLEKDRSDGP